LSDDRKKLLKELIKQLHAGLSPEEARERFKEILGDASPLEIAKVEQELVEEGMPREELRSLCDVHLALFKDSLETGVDLAPAGHPINILMEEHKAVLEFANELRSAAGELEKAEGFNAVKEEIKHLDHIAKHLKESESHYLREENVLFPYLEKHGITEPPAIMWTEHNQIREMKKGVYELLETHEELGFQGFREKLGEVSLDLAEMLSNHFYKENNVLFPAAMKVITGNEWKDVRQQFDELGYCSFTPEEATVAIGESEVKTIGGEVEGMIDFETGSFSVEELESLLDSLPVDITFVDKDDAVRYFSQSKDRIFVRTKAVIGREVQQCHPQKSLHVVNKIVEDFKAGKRDVADFWINLNDRLVYIRYFPVRNKSGEYLGVLEVTQDITDIQKITGQKRLLD
jgi:PAS domain S-box-containing protein